LPSRAELARVRGDPSTTNQIIQRLGTFDADPTGNRDTFCFAPLRDATGNDTIVLLRGKETLRLTTLPGNYDVNYLAIVPTPTPIEGPSIVSTIPRNADESLRDPLIKVVIGDWDVAVVPSSIRLFLGTNELPATITDTQYGAEAEFQVINYLPLGSTQIVTAIFRGDHPFSVPSTNTWMFRVGPLKGRGKSLFVEAEDFNYSNDGVTGGLYANFGDPDCSLTNKAGVAGIDYFQTSGHDPSAVPSYRPTTDVEAAKPGLDGLQRAERTITCSYIVGWNDPGEWQNYTRVFTNNVRYNIYARVSSGGTNEAIEFARIISDAGQSNQIKQVLGEFRSPPTGNWDIFHYVPLQDGCGRLINLRLFGTNTFRLTALPGNFDINYFVFVEADLEGIPPNPAPEGLSIARNSNNIRLSWTRGTLQAAPSISGPWTNYVGAVSPLTISGPGGAAFFRTVCP
jgi:hypothetical protein